MGMRYMIGLNSDLSEGHDIHDGLNCDLCDGHEIHDWSEL